MARQKTPRGPQLELAGELCVAFVNTAGARPENRQLGATSYAELLSWSVATGIVSTAEAERLRRQAAERPGEAGAVFERAAKIRAGLARAFLATQRQKPARQSDFDAVNDALAESSLAQRLVSGGHGASWGWISDDETALDHLLAPVLQSAVEVMARAEGRSHVRQCAAGDCALFFVDRSPSGQRRWCEMKTCGNRAKSLRYYHRIGKAERRLIRGRARR